FTVDPVTTVLYTLSLYDALPICVDRRLLENRRGDGDARGDGGRAAPRDGEHRAGERRRPDRRVELRADAGRDRGERVVRDGGRRDRKSTRLNSSHDQISYAVLCL